MPRGVPVDIMARAESLRWRRLRNRCATLAQFIVREDMWIGSGSGDDEGGSVKKILAEEVAKLPRHTWLKHSR